MKSFKELTDEIGEEKNVNEESPQAKKARLEWEKVCAKVGTKIPKDTPQSKKARLEWEKVCAEVGAKIAQGVKDREKDKAKSKKPGKVKIRKIPGVYTKYRKGNEKFAEEYEIDEGGMGGDRAAGYKMPRWPHGDRPDDPYTVKYSYDKEGRIMVAVLDGKKDAQKFLAAVKKLGMNGIIVKGVSNEEVEEATKASIAKTVKAQKDMKRILSGRKLKVKLSKKRAAQLKKQKPKITDRTPAGYGP